MMGYKEARARKAIADAEEAAAFMNEFMGDDPYVFDEDGHKMTREEILQRVIKEGHEKAEAIRRGDR